MKRCDKIHIGMSTVVEVAKIFVENSERFSGKTIIDVLHEFGLTGAVVSEFMSCPGVSGKFKLNQEFVYIVSESETENEDPDAGYDEDNKVLPSKVSHFRKIIGRLRFWPADKNSALQEGKGSLLSFSSWETGRRELSKIWNVPESEISDEDLFAFLYPATEDWEHFYHLQSGRHSTKRRGPDGNWGDENNGSIDNGRD